MFTLGFISACDAPLKKLPYTDTFAYTSGFINKYQKSIILKAKDTLRQIVVVPAYQARVMTSTFDGVRGKSLGWINYDFIKKRALSANVNFYGGEERFWIGPEGSQFSVFFPDTFSLGGDAWQVPSCVDAEAYHPVSVTDNSVHFTHLIGLKNAIGTPFKMILDRTVRMVEKSNLAYYTDTTLLDKHVKWVAYSTENTLVNIDTVACTPEKGLISIWLLGIFPATQNTVAVMPAQKKLSMNDVVSYFDIIDSNRLKIKNQSILFKTDGLYKSKIGLPPTLAKNAIGSYTPETNILTLLFYNLPDTTLPYVNSLWGKQQNPYNGDVVNVYNDWGIISGSTKLPTFYELETSSPALALKPNESYTHTQTTLHIQAKSKDLDKICRKVLGVSLKDIKNSF